jgi:hypothetical protein
MPTSAKTRTDARPGPRLGVLISGLGRYSLAGMLTAIDGDHLVVKFARRLRLPPERVQKRTVRLTVSFRDDRQWRMLDLRAAIEQVEDNGLRLRLDLPLASDIRERLQAIVNGVPAGDVTPLRTVHAKVDPAAATLTSIIAMGAGEGDAFARAVHTFSRHWLDRILSGIENKLNQRSEREKGPQARRQTQDDLIQLKELRPAIESAFRKKVAEVLDELNQPASNLAARESTVDRTLNLLNTARLEDMMGFVDVVQSIETITHPKMITLCHALTRAMRRNVNEDNNPFRAEKLCECALSSVLDIWSVAQSNRQVVNDAVRDSAVALGAMYAALTDALKSEQKTIDFRASA